MTVPPTRGTLYWVSFDPQVGDETRGRRPGLVVSNDIVNRGPRGISIVVPATSTRDGSRLHPTFVVPGSDRDRRTTFLPEQVRTASHRRIGQPICRVDPAVVDDVVRIVGRLLRDL